MAVIFALRMFTMVLGFLSFAHTVIRTVVRTLANWRTSRAGWSKPRRNRVMVITLAYVQRQFGLESIPSLRSSTESVWLL